MNDCTEDTLIRHLQENSILKTLLFSARQRASRGKKRLYELDFRVFGDFFFLAVCGMSVFAFSSGFLFSLTAGSLICWSLCCTSSVTPVMVHMVDSLFVLGNGESVSSSICAPVSSTTIEKNQLQLYHKIKKKIF